MKIFIVGLGLMGASYAEALTKKGHKVLGYDINYDIVCQAKQDQIIDQSSHLDLLKTADMVILALYPVDNIKFIQTYKDLLKPGQFITDLSGTKSMMMDELEKVLPEGVTYTSHHPMAGREKSGYFARDFKMFRNANFMIVESIKSKPNDLLLLKQLASDLEFGKIIVTNPQKHDELIAFTSQLTHILAVALMHSDHLEETKQATGDSFRDLTRIAKINETMWSELFLENKEALIQKITDFQFELEHIKSLIETKDLKSLIEYLRRAKEKRESFDSN